MDSTQLDLEFSDKFDSQIRQEELDRLNELSRLASQTADLEGETSEIQNLSVKKIFAGLLDACIGMLNDVTAGKPLRDIFLATDRIVYTGLLFILVGICIWLIDFTK